jgi:hypothetical protein
MTKALRTTMAAVLAATTLGLANVQPARADGAASTRNIILGAAALVAGVAIESNVAHKNAQADTIQGYLPGGRAVYADGHVVLPNGQSYYPGNYGQTVACNDGACSLSGGTGNVSPGYDGNGYVGGGYGYDNPYAGRNRNAGDQR